MYNDILKFESQRIKENIYSLIVTDNEHYLANVRYALDNFDVESELAEAIRREARSHLKRMVQEKAASILEDISERIITEAFSKGAGNE